MALISKQTVQHNASMDKCLDVKNVYLIAKSQVNPFLGKGPKCTIMLLHNLAQPDWVSIPCHQKLLHHIACLREKSPHNFSMNYLKEHRKVFCSKGDIIINKTCHSIVWTEKSNNTINLCSSLSMSSISKFQQVHLFQYLFDTTSLQNNFPTVIITNSENISLQFYRVIDTLYYKTNLNFKGTGFFACKTEMPIFPVGINIFYCTKGGYISSAYMCDGFPDCVYDESDELKCFYNETSKITSQTYKTTKPFDRIRCSVLLYTNLKGKCQKYGKVLVSTKMNDKQTMALRNQIKNEINGASVTNCSLGDQTSHVHCICFNGHVIPIVLLNDLVADCGPGAEDEPKLLLLNKFNVHFPCELPGELPCHEGFPKCYSITDVCVFPA